MLPILRAGETPGRPDLNVERYASIHHVSALKPMSIALG